MNQRKPLKGVNLGGWLVLERWITPSVFSDSQAADEASLMRAGFGAEKLDRHRESFIKESDFQWLADNGIDAIRIPVGHWLLEADSPYQPGVEYLDFAFDMADRYGLKVLVCLHAAPGSQNGKQHSGQKGAVSWYRQSNRVQTTRVLADISKRYQGRDSLWGIELLNEPKVRGVSDFIKLKRWTGNTLDLLKTSFPGIRYVYSDAFMPRLWTERSDVTLDMHNYHCFSRADKNRSLSEHIEKLARLKRRYAAISRRQPIIIGEWSAALDRRSPTNIPRRQAELQFVEAQLDTYSLAEAWFFWTYKTENRSSWNFRHLVKSEIIKLN